MSIIDEAYDVVSYLDYRHSGLSERKNKLITFATLYAQLNNDEVHLLRTCIGTKDKFDHFCQASYLFKHCFCKADLYEKRELLKAFFAFYSLDNMEFGYDTLLVLDSTSDLLTGCGIIAKTAWAPYRKLTSSSPRNAIENRLLAKIQ